MKNKIIGWLVSHVCADKRKGNHYINPYLKLSEHLFVMYSSIEYSIVYTEFALMFTNVEWQTTVNVLTQQEQSYTIR